MRLPISINCLRYPFTVDGDTVHIGGGIDITIKVRDLPLLSLSPYVDIEPDFILFFPILVQMAQYVVYHEDIAFEMPPKTGNDLQDFKNYGNYIGANKKRASRFLVKLGTHREDGSLTEAYGGEPDAEIGNLLS